MNSMDVSSLLLIEDGADSEEQYPGFFSLCPSSIAANTGDSEDEDDGESCNCDTASICGLPKAAGTGHKDDKGIGEFCGGEDHDSYESDRGNFTKWMSIGALEDEAETRIGGEVNVNELEDRVFWEMCMAVGYP